MSLYNMVAGYNPSTEQILNLLGLSRASFGRYRDVYIKDGYIIVHTRNGGGNREDHQDVFDDVSSHPWYSHDEDCDYDSTYADIYFTIPEGTDQSAAGLLDQGVPPSERWDALLKALQK
jgi:hypothetical protein